ncbi:hypothetical protein HS088_TW11G00335 [Tripterygium wilfordii]|uniref:FAF domain-containing protein n=1 Tax=Tripterygium wilfordii TaxID=458696 RepID=A0A7J7D207_TRIWF|nr:hypothetical protein HS088_TW11G00335 [Tripterygium wilfordii]
MDFFSGESPLGKVKPMVSYVCGMVLWVSMLKSPMQNPRKAPRTHQNSLHRVGLKTLVYSPSPPPNPQHTNSHIIHSYMMKMISTLSSSPPPPPPPPPPSLVLRTMTSSSSEYDDVIGAESGVNYMNSNEEEMFGLTQENELNSHIKTNHRKHNRSHCAKKRELPPPMTPWVLTRYYCDGRLIIKDETFLDNHHRRRKNFEAVRENGRLILNLAPLEEQEYYYHETDYDLGDGGEYETDIDEDQVVENEIFASNSMPDESSFLWSGIERCDHQDLRKCLTYSDGIMFQHANRNIVTTVV